jgi:cyclic pyranopterin phosphate synthase
MVSRPEAVTASAFTIADSGYGRPSGSQIQDTRRALGWARGMGLGVRTKKSAVPKPSHIAADGSIFMVDVSAKPSSARTARAQARVRLGPEAAAALRDATLAKGDAFAAAQLAGIMAAKQTPALIPLAHGIALAKVDVSFAWEGDTLVVESWAATVSQTGVEMEALVAASVAALTIYDMAKAVTKGIVIESVRLLEKTGGKSGSWYAPVLGS